MLSSASCDAPGTVWGRILLFEVLCLQVRDELGLVIFGPRIVD